jgi:sulfotransferase 6B1
MKPGVINPKSKLQLPARLARRSFRRLRQMVQLHRFSLAGAPVLFANSFPKSGTHLLTQVMEGFTHIGPAVDSGLPAVVTFEGDSGRLRPETEIVADLQRLLPGDIAYGHVHALPAAIAFLCRPQMATYFILRDPRDVVVSHVHYVTEMEPNHYHHHYYHDILQNFDERLTTSIRGITSTTAPFPDIRARFEPYLDWLQQPQVLILHYEDFITQRQEALARVFDHALAHGFIPTVARPLAIQTLADSINPQRSPTFRSGKIGGWKQHFTPQHKRLFKEISGDLLVRLGYEKDDQW